MSDLRNRMERLGNRALVEQGAFERLERRRRRKVRNRRISAGVLALVLTVGGSVVAFSAFRGGDEQTIGGIEADDGFYALWPETTLQEAMLVQSQVERGEEPWRTYPDRVAEEFAGSVFGWRDPRLNGFSRMEQRELDDGRVAIHMFRCPFTPSGLCGRGAASEAVTVTLDEVVEGVWSVVEVDGSALHTGLPVGSVVVDGSELRFPVDVPEGTEVEVSFWYGPPGCASGNNAIGVVRAGSVAVDVSLFGDGACDGDGVRGLDGPAIGMVWLALMEPPTASALGLFSVEPHGFPEAGYVTDLAAVPVLFVPEGSTGSAVPNVARVRCDGADITVDTPIVRAQADGVHLRLTTTNGTFSITEDLGSGVTNGDAPVSSGDGFGTEPGSDTILANVPPARYLLTCNETSDEGGAAEMAGTAPLEVIDPAGYDVPSELDCSTGEAYGMAPGYAEGTLGDPGDPVDIARSRLTGLEEGDLVERAGYPESAAEPVVRIVRDGVVVGKVQLFDDGQGGWLLSSLDGCGGTAFGWSPGMVDTPVPGSACGAPTTEVTLTFEDGVFDLSCVVVPAGEPFTITLVNRDVGVHHSVAVYLPGAIDPESQGDACIGPCRVTHEVQGLGSGTYLLYDFTDPTATVEATLIVE